MRPLTVLLVLTALLLPDPAGACVGLRPPVDGPVVAPFAPVGRYAGHWGVDLGAAPGTTVRSAGPGRISFSGSVAGTDAVTVDHGGGLKTTVSSVADRLVGYGEWVAAGEALAVSGEHDGRSSVHVSTRVDGRYVDPLAVLGCVGRPPADALALVPVP